MLSDPKCFRADKAPMLTSTSPATGNSTRAHTSGRPNPSTSTIAPTMPSIRQSGSAKAAMAIRSSAMAGTNRIHPSAAPPWYTDNMAMMAAVPAAAWVSHANPITTGATTAPMPSWNARRLPISRRRSSPAAREHSRTAS